MSLLVTLGAVAAGGAAGYMVGGERFRFGGALIGIGAGVLVALILPGGTEGSGDGTISAPESGLYGFGTGSLFGDGSSGTYTGQRLIGVYAGQTGAGGAGGQGTTRDGSVHIVIDPLYCRDHPEECY